MKKLFTLSLLVTLFQTALPKCVCFGGTKYGQFATKEMAWHEYNTLEEALEKCTGKITCGPDAEKVLPQKSGTVSTRFKY